MAQNYPIEFGEYRLLRKLAQGGMAEIFLAQNRAGEFCAVKRILPHLAYEEGFIRMFIDEARIVSQLDHPNIAGVLDDGRHDGFYYIAMEFVQGHSLLAFTERAKATKMPLPLGLLSYVVAELLSGLGFAHTARDAKGRPLQIIHRDVTPQNVLISYDGEVKLIDFGVAKARARLTQTEAGFTKGKLSYMSPEQARGEVLDGRSDLFSVGIILHEITTNTRLFNKEGPGGILGAIVNEPIPPPSRRRKEYPKALESIVMRALEKDVGSRWQTAEDMREALLRFARKERPSPGAGRLKELIYDLFGAPDSQEVIEAVQSTSEPTPPHVALRGRPSVVEVQNRREDETRMLRAEYEVSPSRVQRDLRQLTSPGTPAIEVPPDDEPPVPEPRRTEPEARGLWTAGPWHRTARSSRGCRRRPALGARHGSCCREARRAGRCPCRRGSARPHRGAAVGWAPTPPRGPVASRRRRPVHRARETSRPSAPSTDSSRADACIARSSSVGTSVPLASSTVIWNPASVATINTPSSASTFACSSVSRPRYTMWASTSAPAVAATSASSGEPTCTKAGTRRSWARATAASTSSASITGMPSGRESRMIFTASAPSRRAASTAARVSSGVVGCGIRPATAALTGHGSSACTNTVGWPPGAVRGIPVVSTRGPDSSPLATPSRSVAVAKGSLPRSWNRGDPGGEPCSQVVLRIRPVRQPRGSRRAIQVHVGIHEARQERVSDPIDQLCALGHRAPGRPEEGHEAGLEVHILVPKHGAGIGTRKDRDIAHEHRPGLGGLQL